MDHCSTVLSGDNKTDLKVSRDGHVDGLAGRRHPVQQQRVVQRRVPGGLKPEVGSLVSAGVEVLAREESERQHAAVEVVVDVRLRRDAKSRLLLLWHHTWGKNIIASP